jgi:chromosome segregation ATPase
MTKIETIESRIAKLQKEHQSASAKLAEAQNARSDYAAELHDAQASAARNGDTSAADRAEQEDDKLQRTVQRWRAAVAAIDHDLAKAHRQLEQAHHDAKAKRIAAIHKQAAKLADRLDADLGNADHLGALVDLWRENVNLARDLYGDRVELAGHAHRDQVIVHPDKAYDQRLAALRYFARGGRWKSRDDTHHTQQYHPVSMREALRLG